MRQRPASQFSNVTFDGATYEETKAKLDAWLKDTSKCKVTFVDKGQDLLEMHIHESGEILDCNHHGQIYNGGFVEMEKLKEFEPIHIFHRMSDDYVPMQNLIVEQIITING